LNFEYIRIPCHIVRGGTSKGIFFRGNDLPAPGPERDALIHRAFGGVDARQIDGLGGANSLTSKVAIIESSKRPDADIDYTFGQVSFTRHIIDWRGNCGNISSAAALYAVDMGLVPVEEPLTTVRIYNTNTDKLIIAEVPVKNGKTQFIGDYEINGAPFPGAKILLDFFEPAGSVTGKLLPTGNAKDSIDLGEDGVFEVSIVDAANPVVFLKAEQLGLSGAELPVELEARPELLSKIERIRCIAAEMAGIVPSANDATAKSPAIPKIGFVSKAQSFVNPNQKEIQADSIDITARLCSMQKMHRAYMVTGAICTGAASKIKGTVVWEMLDERAKASDTLRIGQPYGPMDVKITSKETPDGVYFEKIGVGRTARMILEGQVFVPANYMDCFQD